MAAETGRFPDRNADTVAVETPASRAMSRMLTRGLPFRRGSPACGIRAPFLAPQRCARRARIVEQSNSLFEATPVAVDDSSRSGLCRSPKNSGSGWSAWLTMVDESQVSRGPFSSRRLRGRTALCQRVAKRALPLRTIQPIAGIRLSLFHPHAWPVQPPASQARSSLGVNGSWPFWRNWRPRRSPTGLRSCS